MVKVLLCAASLLFSAQIAYATFTMTGGGGVSITLVNPLGCTDFTCVTTAIVNTIFTAAFYALPIMVLVGAFQILIAAGSEEKLRSGRNTIFYAVIGFTVALLGKGVILILQTIFTP